MRGGCAVALAVAAGLALHGAATGQCQYEVSAIIQAPPCPFVGPPITTAVGMSSDGRVAGYYEICGTAFHEAFVWTPNPDAPGGGTFQTLPRPANVLSARGADVNSLGFVVGGHLVLDTGWKGFLFDPATQEYMYLDPLHPELSAQTVSTLNALNDSNIAVGSRAITPPGVSPVWSNAVIWHPFGADGDGGEPVVNDLGTFGVGPSSSARAVNQAGTTVVGWTGTGGDVAIPFRRDTDGSFALLDGSFGLDLGFANGVRNDGTIVGSAIFNGDPGKAYIWSDSATTIIEPIRGFTSGGAFGLNKLNQTLVACSNGPNHTPAIYQGGATTLLVDLLITDQPITIDLPRAINDSGYILVRGRLAGRTVGVLLAPADRPITDLNADCVTNVHDLIILLDDWGPCDGCPADFTGSGTVGVPDLLLLLANWG